MSKAATALLKNSYFNQLSDEFRAEYFAEWCAAKYKVDRDAIYLKVQALDELIVTIKLRAENASKPEVAKDE